MSGCGPENPETEPAPAAAQEGQRKAEIGPNQNWLTTFFSDAAKTHVVGAIDYCPAGSTWGTTGPYSTTTIITCVGSPLR